MSDMPNEELRRERVTGNLERDQTTIGTLFGAPANEDIKFRAFFAAGFPALIAYVEGMAGAEMIDRYILKPCMALGAPEEALSEAARADYLMERVLAVSEAEKEDGVGELSKAILQGKTALFCEGCPSALLLETRDFEKRDVGKPQTETVVVGSQEGFVENMRTNITLMRRILKSEKLITELMSVGTKIPSNMALIYLQGAANPEALDRLRRRLKSLNVAQCPGTGYLQQLIEDHPYSLFPQILQTERPDRAASCVSDGQIAVLVDGSPYALLAPTTFWTLMHASDDSFMRWQYGSFIRIVRMLGLVISLLLPATYMALTTYHPHMIPMEMITAIAESRAKVPFSVLTEILMMEFSFYLINEAGTRMPTAIGPALGIVGALILGQAAVAASIVSPILIIIVALAGLGNYAVPHYGMGIGVQILRLCFVFAGVTLGIYGISLGAMLLLARLCGMCSFGEPYMAPVAPYKPHNPDIVLRLPLWRQNLRLFLSGRDSWMRSEKSDGAWRRGGR